MKSSESRLPDGFCVVVDTREQLPYGWPGVATMQKALPLGDYSVLGLENRIGVERKSHADFVATVTRHHQEFFSRFTGDGTEHGLFTRGSPGCHIRGTWIHPQPYYAIIVEATAASLDSPMSWTRVSPASVHANIIKLACLGIPVWPAGSRIRAAAWTLAYLRRAFEEIRGLHP